MMYPSKDIVSNAVNSRVHTTLVAAVKQQVLLKPCKVAGAFYGFCTCQCRIRLLPAGTVATLLKVENKPMLLQF